MTFLLLLSVFYFLPTLLASNRGHDITGVLLLNLFFGWTVVGWIALLLWALLSQPCYRIYPIAGTYYPPGYWRR